MAVAHLHSRAADRTIVDIDTLEQRLRETIAGEVRFDAASRALYATDASNYRHVPIGVVVPRSIEDIVNTIHVCHDLGAPVLARGAGTSIAGQSCNVAVIIDSSKYLNHVLGVDRQAGTARVEPGTVLDDLNRAAQKESLAFGPDPGTHRWCTLGGMIGNNSCGVHSMLSEYYGPGPTTAHHVESLDVVTYGGVRMRIGATSDDEYGRIVAEGGPRADIYRRLKAFQERYADAIRREFPDIPRRISGYNLPALLPENGFHVGRAVVGSECTLVYVLEAKLHLARYFPERVLVVLGYRDIFEAADAVPPIIDHHPIGLEGVDDILIRTGRHSGVHDDALRLLPRGSRGCGWLYVEFGGDTAAEARELAENFVSQMRDTRNAPDIRVFESKDDQRKLWEIREAGGPAVPPIDDEPAMCAGWDDSAVAPAKLGAYLRDLHALYKKYDYTADLFGHFGQGCVHCRVSFELHTTEGVAKFRSFMEEAADLVSGYGGSLSGEHGDGQARGELLSRMYSKEMIQAFHEFKSIWDPDWKMNPGKIIDAQPLDADLRVGPGTHHDDPHTHFHFREDGDSFAQATLRCVGIGKCRKHDEGTMCPSYLVTHEEKHATRGRAHLLYEMLRGEEITDGWASEEVHEALDLCLSCKGCKGECPVKTDMATYKAEFLSHYYEHHWRPRTAYAFGLIHRWAALASRVPRLVNFLTQTPGLGAIARFVAGMAPQRRIPAFAPFTFREWFLNRSRTRGAGGTRVVLWPDTFNNHFHPETAIAAVELLEDAGFDVDIPRARLCCGRPLYDYGMLDQAKQQLRDIITALSPEIDEGIPIVGLEPSCIAVFRDEMKNLFPDDHRAQRLSTLVVSLGEFLAKHADALPPMALPHTAIVHGHCHQKALFGLDDDLRVLERAGVRYEVVDSGCCGMAGSFGFEEDHYGISQAIGERRLLPRVRTAGAGSVIVANGFSCREQIAQGTDRVAMHLADLLAAARRQPNDVSGSVVERSQVGDYSNERLPLSKVAAVLLLVTGTVLAIYNSKSFNGSSSST